MGRITTAEWVLAGVIMAGFFFTVLAMLAGHYKLVADAAIEEAREEADENAARQADRMYRRALATAQIHVVQRLRIINESDIDWGKEEIE